MGRVQGTHKGEASSHGASPSVGSQEREEEFNKIVSERESCRAALLKGRMIHYEEKYPFRITSQGQDYPRVVNIPMSLLLTIHPLSYFHCLNREDSHRPPEMDTIYTCQLPRGQKLYQQPWRDNWKILDTEGNEKCFCLLFIYVFTYFLIIQKKILLNISNIPILVIVLGLW